MRRNLLSPDGPEGTLPATPSGTPSNPDKKANEGPSTPATPAHNQAPPIVATAIVTGTKTEKELELERQLENERKSRKAEQTRISELEDQKRRLEQAGQTQDQVKKQKKSFLEGATFFGSPDDD